MKILNLISLLAACSLVSCGSIFNGRTQQVGISSNPAGATVKINGAQKGVTPLTVLLKRADAPYNVEIEKPGYEPYSCSITNSISAWEVGNVAFGGFIGLGVDSLTGGMYYLEPAPLQADLKPARTHKEKGEMSF